ncbi:MAG: hypothetical protein ABJA67_11820 [Chthonomonadales bacterium]
MTHYKGWKIWKTPTGAMQIRAERSGVTMCGNTEAAIKSSIDLHPPLSLDIRDEFARNERLDGPI